MKKTGLLVLALLALMAFKNVEKDKKDQGPAKVTLEQHNGKYRLYVNGEEFFVKGAGLEFGKIDALGEHGANSFRTWRTSHMPWRPPTA